MQLFQCLNGSYSGDANLFRAAEEMANQIGDEEDGDDNDDTDLG